MGAWGLPDDAEGTARVLPDLRRGVRRGRTGRQATGGLLRTPRFGRAWPSSSGSCVDAAEAGLLVLADAKRGDIDTTAAAYADAWLGEGSTLAADAVTVHPYLGLGALAPLIRWPPGRGRGVIVVTRSSNPEGRLIQEAVTRSGDVGRGVTPGGDRRSGTRSPGVPPGTVGAVIGATLARSVVPIVPARGVILAPGLGAQGAQPARSGRPFRRVRPGSVAGQRLAGATRRGPEIGRSPPGGGRLGNELGSVLG